MKTLTKILLTLSISLFFVGVVMCGLAYVVGGTDLSKMDFDTAYEEKDYVSSSSLIKNIKIDADRHNIVIKESLSVSTVTVKYSENQYDKFVITDNGDSLSLTNKDSKNAFIRIFCLLFDSKNTDEKVITVVVPSKYTGNINITASKSDVEIDSIKNLDVLNVDLSSGDVVLNSLSCTNAVLETKTGDVTVSGGTYTSFDITAANPVQYVPIDEVDPDLLPSGTIVPVTPTVVPSETPNQTLSPIETPTESENPEVSPFETPSVTPVATATPSATKTPTILVVEASIMFDKADIQNLTVNAVYTNIEGSLARGSGYYKITTNNITSSNIKTNDNISAVGTITISQNEGKTELEFR